MKHFISIVTINIFIELRRNWRIIYRILKGEIKVDNYSKESFEEYVKPLTLENYEGLFDFEERDNLKANYELLVFERFRRYYLRKII